ncbi:hypothetical protein VTK73DRAFT_4943 [Phialemonium thermophilum]|uniref:Uncharacterized protein n=1 Tax=Phialemonium thermophilum TaxID=223376 RepID=A0ABR3V4N1_9PEZI
MSAGDSKSHKREGREAGDGLLEDDGVSAALGVSAVLGVSTAPEGVVPRGSAAEAVRDVAGAWVRLSVEAVVFRRVDGPPNTKTRSLLRGGGDGLRGADEGSMWRGRKARPSSPSSRTVGLTTKVWLSKLKSEVGFLAFAGGVDLFASPRSTLKVKADWEAMASGEEGGPCSVYTRGRSCQPVGFLLGGLAA